MEVWILLAAAGSGYLARRWQNAQKPKGSSADGVEDGNNADPLSHMPSYRGRYRHFSSSGRRQIGKSLCGKGSPYWVRQPPKNVGNATEHKMGGRVNGGEGGTKICREGHTLDDDRKECETCLGSGAVKTFQTSSRDCRLELADQSNGIESKNFSAEQDLSDYLSSMQLSKGSESRMRNMAQDKNVSNGLDRDLQEEVAEGKVLADAPQPLSFFRSFSGKRASDSVDEKAFKSGYMHQDGYAGKRMKDAVDNTASLEEGFMFGTWMPGFWDVSEGVFILDTESLLVQQENGSRSKGSSSRKIRTPSKYGKSRGTRKRNLAARKPMSSLESCLSAQLDDDYNRRTIQNSGVIEPSANAVARSLGKQPSNNADFFASEGKLGVLRAEFAIGLPSLSRQPSSKKFSSNPRIPKSLTGRASNGDVCNPFSGKKYSVADKPTQSIAGLEIFGRRGKEKCVEAPNARYTRGAAGSSLEGLLFNFGVGVGMMFTVMSNMREVRRLTLLLKEAELLIKDLEGELEGKDERRLDSFKNNSAVESAALEQRQTVVTNTLKKVRSATQSLSSMRALLTNESEAASTSEHVQSKDISKLEAELEAELERMELSLGDGDMFKLQRKSSGPSEFDGEVGNMVQGELTIIGLPHEIEVDSEDEDDSNSSHEDLHVSNYAVSPRALAKRLHEVLEARQEERISELEAELKLLGSKLHVKEEEVCWLKERSLGLRPGDAECLPGSVEKSDQNSGNYTWLKQVSETDGFSNMEHFLHPQISLTLNASPVSPNFPPHATNNAPLKSSSLFKGGVENKSSTAFITLGGEALAAYKEACDEFSKISSDPVRTCPAVDRNAESYAFYADDSVKEASAKECHMDSLHMGNSDGWEQVDLLSLAEDFYVGGDLEFMENMPTLRSISSKGRHCPRRRNSRNKGSVSSHPEPEQPFSSSRGVDSSDDATNDTSGSTPCSVKFMDVSTVGFCHSEDQLGNKPESEADSINHPPYSDWSEEILIRAGVNTPNQEEFHSIYPEREDSPGKFVSAALKPGDWAVPDESDHFSELDEQLGHLLIKRIVEKSRKGSPIIRDAQTVLASLERNDTPQATD